MAENADALKKGFDAFNSGDTDAVAAVSSDEVKWERPNTQDVPGGRTTDGKHKDLDMLAGNHGDWEEVQATPGEVIDAGGHVIVLRHLSGKHKESGKDLKTPFVHVWRMEDSKGKRVQSLVDTHEVLEAMKGSGGDDGDKDDDS